MNVQLKALHLLAIPVWVERKLLPTVESSPKTVIFLQESKSAFTDKHQEQLQKICAYLQLHAPTLVYADTKTKPSALNFGINFGLKPETLPSYPGLIHTLAISEMLNNPSCKRQVLNDLKAFHSQNA